MVAEAVIALSPLYLTEISFLTALGEISVLVVCFCVYFLWWRLTTCSEGTNAHTAT